MLNEIEEIPFQILSYILSPFAGAVAGAGHALRRGGKEVAKGAWRAGWGAAKEFLKGAWQTALKRDPKKLTQGVREAFKKGWNEFRAGVGKGFEGIEEIPKGMARWWQPPTLKHPLGKHGWATGWTGDIPSELQPEAVQNLIKDAQQAMEVYVNSFGTAQEDENGLKLEQAIEKVLIKIS